MTGGDTPDLVVLAREALEDGKRNAVGTFPDVPGPGEMLARWIFAARTREPLLAQGYLTLHETLTKISAIRDSIVGMQGFNFSEHAYPLVAALTEAGYMGAGYEISRANLGTLIEHRDAAIAECAALRGKLAEAEAALNSEALHNAERYTTGMAKECALRLAKLEQERDALLSIRADRDALFDDYVIAMKERDAARQEVDILGDERDRLDAEIKDACDEARELRAEVARLTAELAEAHSKHTRGMVGSVAALRLLITKTDEEIAKDEEVARLTAENEQLRSYRDTGPGLVKRVDELLAERHAICDALQIDNDEDAANPAAAAMRLTDEECERTQERDEARAEVARLIAERDVYRHACERVAEEKYEEEVARLTAENERLARLAAEWQYAADDADASRGSEREGAETFLAQLIAANETIRELRLEREKSRAANLDLLGVNGQLVEENERLRVELALVSKEGR